MESNRKNFNELLKFGQEGEHLVAQLLIEKGVNIMPLYQFDTTHAPFIISESKFITCPDLICFKKDVFMVEVKTKNQWVVFGDRVETGISQKHFNQYLKVKEFSNKDVFLFFNHKDKEPLGIYYCKIDAYTRKWDGVVKGRQVYEPMVFYSFEVLTKL